MFSPFPSSPTIMDDLLDKVLTEDGATVLTNSKIRMVDADFMRRGKKSPYHIVREQ